MKLYFLTGNAGKFDEVHALIPQVEQLDVDLPELQEISAEKIIQAKLTEAYRHHAGQFIVEDTSLYFDCLQGLPGPLIKWFLKTMGNNGLAELVQLYGNNRAQAKTILGYAEKEGSVNFFEGSVYGSITSPRGENGFGWDMIFQPDGQTKTFGEMSAEEKSTFSMRRLAVEKLRKHLHGGI